MMQLNPEIAPTTGCTDDLDEKTLGKWRELAERLHNIDPDKFRELLSIATDIVEANEMLDRVPWPKRGVGVLQA